MTTKQNPRPLLPSNPGAAVLALADIKAASAAFDRGDTNAHDALDAIASAIRAYLAALEPRRTAA